MQVMTESRTRFSDELKLIPGWAMVLASVLFVGMQIVCNVVLARDNHAPPVWGRIALGLGAGSLVAAYILLIGYINQDAGRRGMSRLLWTTIAVLVPNALGIILYFLLRKPSTLHCSQCGSSVESGFNFCPRCSTKLQPTCPHCQREIRPGNDFCPYCGRSLKTEAPASV